MTNEDVPVWTRAEIESPCVRVCVVHPKTGLCVGCFRTMEEIRDWSRYTPEHRSTVMAGLPEREPLIREAGLAKRRERRSERRPR